MPDNAPPTTQIRDLGRLIALIDGVFAVAMTLLILDLKLPPLGDSLASQLRQLLPGLVVYLIVFASIAGYWFQHLSAFRYIAHGTPGMIVLSLTNLLFVTLYPLTASIVGARPLEPLAAACLSTNSLLYCVSAAGVWLYAARRPRLLKSASAQRKLERLALVMILVAASLLLAIPLAYVSVYLAYADWIVCAPAAAWVSGRIKIDRQ